jgi:hypothetical protein
MDHTTAKTELLTNHFQHALHELIGHLQECGDREALVDLRLLVDAALDDAILKTKPQSRLIQNFEQAD